MARQPKYAEICKDLPRLPEDATYQQKVDVAKTALIEKLHDFDATSGTFIYPSAGSFASEFRKVRDAMDDLHEEEKQLQLQLTAVEQLLADRYENDGVRTCVLDDGTSVSVQEEPHATVTDRAANRAWAIANDYGDQLSLAWVTLNAIVKEHRLNGQPDPDGVSVWRKQKFVLRRG